MPLFSSYPESTAPDLDDSYLVLVDGSVSRVTGASTKAFALPDGLFDVADSTLLAGSLLQSADSLTGWTLAAPSSGAVITLNTTGSTQGTGHVQGSFNMTIGQLPKLYYTFTTPQPLGTHTLVAFDVKWVLDGAVGNPVPYLYCAVADGTTLTSGNVQTLPFPQVASNVWATVVLPLTGLSAIKSIGVGAQGQFYPPPGNNRTIIRIDNVRWIDETKLDQALNAAPAAVAWVPPDYTPDADQYPLFLPAGRGLIDPAKGVYSKANNVIWLHDYLAHVVGAETGEVEAGSAIARIINSAPAGSTIRATPGATYRFDNDVDVYPDDLIIDFTGATCFLSYASNTPFWTFSGSHNTHIMGGTWLGYYPITAGGSALTTVTGTPTTSGTTKLLDALDEEVKIPAHVNWATVSSHFARHLPQQLGLPADGGAPRCYWEFTLSDTTHVAGDCIISVYDDTSATFDFTPDALLASSTLTLTSTPTVYRISYTPLNMRQRHKVTVRKATATANTITVTNYTAYGESEYNATYDIASCFLLANTTGLTISDMWIEGFGGDAIQVSDANVHFLTVRNVTSRGCRRQGMSFNQGTDMVIENCTISETGRSGIDFEPYAADWFTKRVTVRDITFYNITNYGFAMQNWARNFDFVIDGVDMYDPRLGVIFGGFNRGVIKNMRNWANNWGAGADYDFMGMWMDISNIRSKVEVWLHENTSTFDDGTGIVTFTPANNVIDSRSITIVAGTGITWGAGYRDLNADLFLAANTGAAYTARRTALRQDFLLTVTANTTITLAGGALLNNELSVWNIVFKQDATGGRTITVSGVTWAGGTPTFTTTALASNHCSFVQHGTGPIYGYYGGAAAT